MERLNISKPVAKTYENGVTVQARIIEPLKRPIPGETAEHEAAHVVAAGEIVYATIIPSGNALGATKPVRMTAAAAAAAEAMGHSGTGWDMFLTEHYLGVDPGIAKSAAKAALSGRQEEIEEVASLLEERKTIGQGDVDQARRNVEKRRDGIHPVEVQISSPEGQTKVVTTLSFRGEIKIQDNLLTHIQIPISQTGRRRSEGSIKKLSGPV